jgi:predicted house-cleaning noncanonical NTP pyrophosphatase (MazG superfamily)
MINKIENAEIIACDSQKFAISMLKKKGYVNKMKERLFWKEKNSLFFLKKKNENCIIFINNVSIITIVIIFDKNLYIATLCFKN